MTRNQIFSLMLKCNGPELDIITQKLELNPAVVPAKNEAVATRASGILELAERRDQGLAKLEKILLEFFPQGPTGAPKQKKILVLAANPLETDRLMLAEEVRLIKERLNEQEAGREFRVESEWAVRPDDLSKFLLEHEPVIVHFSGHGSPTGDLILQSETGAPAPVGVNVFANLFQILKSPTECVVLNACYSSAQAQSLANYVGCVVGMNKAIGDESALRFTGGFYRGLAFGRDYLTAFQLGSNAIELAALPDVAVPHFTKRGEEQIAAVTAERNETTLRPRMRTWVGAASPPAPEAPDAPKLYPVWFGTNRRPVDPEDLSKGFSSERDAVRHGLCKVAVPKAHKFGSVGSSWWKRLVTLTDDRLKLKEISVLEEAAFWEAARQALLQWPTQDRMAMIFIHGFNVSFEDAALHAAQMGVDLKITGETAFYSWPSRGKLSLRDYTADEASISASEQQITDFLVGFSQKTEAQRVQVIAHSMGNRGLLRAMQKIIQNAAEQAKKPFRNVIFAAPDEDADTFRQMAAAHKGVADKATLYVSSRDRAVASSGLLHKHQRAGYTPPTTLVDGIDTVDVTNADLTWLGHGYYGAAEGVLYDMHELVSNDTVAEKRLKLQRPPDNGNYWRISQ